jgi:hypothetical protein
MQPVRAARASLIISTVVAALAIAAKALAGGNGPNMFRFANTRPG